MAETEQRTSTKHTPGPWSVAPNGHCVFTDALETGRGIALCAMKARTAEEIIANARLIAKAPEMISALREAVAMTERNIASGVVSAQRTPEYEQLYHRFVDIVAAVDGEEGTPHGA